MFEIIKLDFCPLTLLRPSGTPSDEELTNALDAITEFLETEKRVERRGLMIVDMSQAGALRAGQRRIASDWMKRNNHLYKHVALGSALIISSPIVRGVLTALLWVSPVEMPYESFSNLNDAVRWVIERFEAEHLPVPERLRRELGNVFDVQPWKVVESH